MGVFKYNTGGGGGVGGLRLPYVYVGGAHEKRLGTTALDYTLVKRKCA